MLMVDAWFDVTTAADRKQFVTAVVLACIAEIPLAIICGWAAVNAERIRARAYRSLRVRWETALKLLRERTGSVVSSPPPARPPR